jgi:DHA1 family bicyclomycin/chloramphenicol resistance-like MFS transporter
VTRLKPNSRGVTIVLALLTSLGPLSTDLYLPSLPFIAVDLASSISRTQLTLSAFLFGFAAGQFFYGSLSDIRGRKPVLAGGLALFVLASLGCAAAPNIETLIACRFLQALGGSGPVVLARAMVRDLYEGRRAAQELSRMASIMGVVPAIAPVLGGFLQEAFGWRSAFFACFGFGALLTMAALSGLPETIRVRSQERFSLITIVRGFGHLLRLPAYRAYVGLATLTYSGLFAWISGSSFILQGIYGMSEIAFGFSFLVVVLGYVGGTILAQRLVVRRGPERTVGTGIGCLFVGGVAMAALMAAGISSPIAVLLPMALYTCGVGLTLPPSMALAMAPFPDRAGAASSFLGLCQMGCAALVGAGVASLLGASAMPMALAIATTGTLALILFWTTRRIRGT